MRELSVVRAVLAPVNELFWTSKVNIGLKHTPHRVMKKETAHIKK
jgi:hypothetical protein